MLAISKYHHYFKRHSRCMHGIVVRKGKHRIVDDVPQDMGCCMQIVET